MGIDVNDVKKWAKDHPLVSGVLLFFYLLYIFSPSLFDVLFYTFPLVICAAILLGKPRKSPRSDIKCFTKIEEKTISCDNNATSKDQRRRPYLTSQMSRRTFGKDKSKEPIPSVFPTGDDDPVISKILEEEILPLKVKKEIYSLDSLNLVLEKTQISATSTVFSENKLVEWTEDDQRNLMDLGASDIERNKRLESLIAKRRAKKLPSMPPRRIPLEYLCSHHPSFDHHIDQVGVIARTFDDSERHRKLVGSTLLKRNSQNPFDLPYEPQEEKPDLTGGTFREEFCGDVHKDMQSLCRHRSFNRGGEHPLVKSLPSFFLKKPGFTRFRGDLDVGDYMKEFQEEPSQEGNDRTPKGQDTPSEGQIYRTLSFPDDQSAMFPSEEGKLESETFAKDNAEGNIEMNSNPTVEENNDDGDDSTSSSSSSSTGSGINGTKNEAFRSSVKKVLTCLVRPRNKGLLGKETYTKMEERSVYTNKPQHSRTFSIASDMQVEVSDTGSPTSGPPDPNSPTDRESLVYDGDVDKDANSGDEDLWGASPHPTKLRLHDIIEESSNRGSKFETTHHADELPPTLSRSMLHEESYNQEVMDQKSTNGDIIEPRSYCSSASSSSSPSPSSSSRPKGIIASQMQGKSEHLAEYLASLPPTETGSSSTLEESGPPHVRATSAEVISVQDESNAIFETEEDKDESKESKEFEQSREHSDKTTTTSQPEESNEDGSKGVVEDTSGVREPPRHENEVIWVVMSEKDKTVTSRSQDEGEVKSKSPRNPIIDEKSTSPTTEANQTADEMNKSDVNEASEEGKEKMQENEGENQSARVEDDNKKLPSAQEEIHSREVRRDRGAYKHDTSFE